MYHRNASEQRLGALIRSGAHVGGSNLEGIGEVCFPMGIPWTVLIGAEGPDSAVGEYLPLLSSADVSDPMDAQIWIDVAEDGTVTWDEGRPDWAMEGGIAEGCRASVP